MISSPPLPPYPPSTGGVFAWLFVLMLLALVLGLTARFQSPCMPPKLGCPANPGLSLPAAPPALCGPPAEYAKSAAGEKVYAEGLLCVAVCCWVLLWWCEATDDDDACQGGRRAGKDLRDRRLGIFTNETAPPRAIVGGAPPSRHPQMDISDWQCMQSHTEAYPVYEQ